MANDLVVWDVVEEVALTPWQRFKSTPEASLDALCAQLAGGESLLACTKRLGTTMWAMYKWVHAPEREPAYRRACEARADYWAGVIEALHDEKIPLTPFGTLDAAAVAHKRLKLDALKWTAAKLNPRRYGDKLDVSGKVEVDSVGELRDFLSGTRLKVAKQGPEE